MPVCRYAPLNSCLSHALANCQSRLTVRGELFQHFGSRLLAHTPEITQFNYLR
jgi:hypothetical protein